MFNSQSHLAANAKNALQNHLREQEDRKKALLREQQVRDLRQFETNLFHKQQEVQRIKAQLDRLKREAVVRESKFKNSIQDVQQQNHVKDLERQLTSIDSSLQTKLNDITQKIEQKKREIQALEKQKEEVVLHSTQQKNTLTSSIRNSKSELQSAQRYKDGEQRLFETTQRQITGLEQSLKTFTQEITVLDNKIKALKVAMR